MKMKEKKLNSKSILLAVLVAANVILAGLLLQSISEERSLEAQFSEQTDAAAHVQEEIKITLPETIYVASGITMEIYNSQVSSLGEDIGKYNILWNCEVGENLERKFSVTADETNVGTYELCLVIYNNELQLVAKENCTLAVVEEKISQKEDVEAISNISEIPQACLEQVKICVDTVYNGTLNELKPEGWKQMQDVVYSVLCGL